MTMGKCSHGGKYDESRYLNPTGGINSESFNYSLSPKAFLHKSSSQSAYLSSLHLLTSGKLNCQSGDPSFQPPTAKTPPHMAEAIYKLSPLK